MIRYFVLRPEVAGGFGSRTVAVDPTARPPVLREFHYEFHGWLGDELLTTVGCFIVTEALARTLKSARLTGFEVDTVHISKSPGYAESSRHVALPSFVWFKVTGQPCVEDFGIAAERKFRLVASDGAMAILRKHAIAHCEVSSW